MNKIINEHDLDIEYQYKIREEMKKQNYMDGFNLDFLREEEYLPIWFKKGSKTFKTICKNVTKVFADEMESLYTDEVLRESMDIELAEQTRKFAKNLCDDLKKIAKEKREEYVNNEKLAKELIEESSVVKGIIYKEFDDLGKYHHIPFEREEKTKSTNTFYNKDVLSR